jgi:hypothetical protein
LFKIDAKYLIEEPKCLKQLYKYFNLDESLNLKGVGNEVSDFNKVMRIYKNWHFEVGSKLEFGYFCARVTKAGEEKEVRDFMNKLRKVYKGDEEMEEFK